MQLIIFWNFKESILQNYNDNFYFKVLYKNSSHLIQGYKIDKSILPNWYMRYS